MVYFEVLKRRFVVLAADGAGVHGGADARHSSSNAGQILWGRVFQVVLEQGVGAEWDAFHRLDICTRRAIARVPAALEVFDLCRIMCAFFGTGDGRAVLRGSADIVGVKSYTVPDQGGTRKIVALSHSFRNLLHIVDAYAAGCILAAA